MSGWRIVVVLSFVACAARGVDRPRRAAQGEPCGGEHPCAVQLACCTPVVGTPMPNMDWTPRCQTPCRDEQGLCNDGCPTGVP